MPKQDERARRLAEALRANLRRRKAQARGGEFGTSPPAAGADAREGPSDTPTGDDPV